MHARRRQRLLEKLGDGLLILPTAPETIRNGDVNHSFRAGSDLFYLTGFSEPDTILVASRTGRGRHKTILFVRPRDKTREVWDGPRAGVRGVIREFGADEAFPIGEFWKRLPGLVGETPRVFHTLGLDDEFDERLMAVFRSWSQSRRRRNPPAHPAIEDPRPALAELRLIKDTTEIRDLQEAARISTAGHLRAMAKTRGGMMEFEVQAALEGEFRRQGSRRNGYDSIVASGANACVLHYIENDRKMRRGDLLLIDAGAESNQYTADITRTFPVSGQFSPPQKEIYQAVLSAQKAAIKAVRPGAAWDAPHKTAVRVLTRRLVKLGILKGDPIKLIKKGACRKWFMHGTSHWLGMDVHDVGSYEDPDGRPIKLRAGMVLTVEPGLYIERSDKSVAAEYRGIGVRIEDDVLVTRSGHRVLTAAVPKEVKDVEAACSV